GPPRGLQRRPGGADRDAGGGVRAPRHPVRGRLRRHREPPRPRGGRRAHGAGRDVQRPPGEGPAGAGSPDAPDDEVAALGEVREVSYAGAITRYTVDLDAGATFVVLEQNTSSSHADVAALRGRRVRLTWQRRDAVRLPTSPAEPAEPSVISTKTA